MSDQHAHWTSVYAGNESSRLDRPASAFAEHAMDFFPAGSRVLELGCGRGADAARFASAGFEVLATDFLESAIEANRIQYANLPGVTFQTIAISAAMPFSEEFFDAIYAHLSLHYFTDMETRAIFREIHRLLKSGGTLAFICKSIDDPLYGQGSLIEPAMFDLNGHVRHFFSEDYARALVEGLFDIADLSSGKTDFYRSSSAFVSVIATKV